MYLPGKFHVVLLYDEGEKTPVVSNLLIKRLIVNILYQMMKMYKFNTSSVREIHLTWSALLDPMFSCSCIAILQNRAAYAI